MRSDALKSDNNTVRKEITGEKHIKIYHVCSTDDNKSKELLVGKNLLQVCSMDKDELKKNVNEGSTEERKSECFHKSINKEKYAKNESEH